MMKPAATEALLSMEFTVVQPALFSRTPRRGLTVCAMRDSRCIRNRCTPLRGTSYESRSHREALYSSSLK